MEKGKVVLLGRVFSTSDHGLIGMTFGGELIPLSTPCSDSVSLEDQDWFESVKERLKKFKSYDSNETYYILSDAKKSEEPFAYSWYHKRDEEATLSNCLAHLGRSELAERYEENLKDSKEN